MDISSQVFSVWDWAENSYPCFYILLLLLFTPLWICLCSTKFYCYLDVSWCILQRHGTSTANMCERNDTRHLWLGLLCLSLTRYLRLDFKLQKPFKIGANNKQIIKQYKMSEKDDDERAHSWRRKQIHASTIKYEVLDYSKSSTWELNNSCVHINKFMDWLSQCDRF